MSWLQTRESSTLAVVTFLAGFSLSLLTADKIESVAVYGFAFALAGLFYRQATVWYIDRIQHNREIEIAKRVVERAEISFGIQDEIELSSIDDCLAKKIDIIRNRRIKKIYFAQAGIREFIVWFFLSMPVVIWCSVLLQTSQKSFTFLPTDLVICGLIFAVIFTVADITLRFIDRCNG